MNSTFTTILWLTTAICMGEALITGDPYWAAGGTITGSLAMIESVPSGHVNAPKPASTPEPAGLVVIGVGLVGLATRRKFRNR